MRNEEIRRLHTLSQRILWSLVWFVAINYFIAIGTSWNRGISFAWIGFFGVLASVTGMLLPWVQSSSPPPWYTHTSAAVVTAMAFWHGWLNIANITRERSDASALNDFAVKLWSHGVDPYTASMTGATSTLGSPAAMWTYTLNGGHVSTFSYPAGALTFETPLRWLGVTHLTGSWFNLGAWILTCLLAYWLLPHSLRAVAILAVFLGGSMALGGTSTDAAWMPFLLLAVYQWDRFAETVRPWFYRYLGPAALGVACSFKITPWFVVPFILVGIFLETRRRFDRPFDAVLRYLAVVVGSFLVVNLPFIVLSPMSWLRGAILPVTSGLIPGGQGLVSLVIHGDLPGVRTTPMSLAGLVVVAMAILAFARWYPTLKAGFLFFIPALFFIPERSYATYFESFFLVAVVAGATVAASDERIGAAWRREWRIGALVTPGVAVVGLLAYSLFVPVLSSSVAGTTIKDGLWSGLTLVITNHSAHVVTAHVLVSVDDFHGGGFWLTPTGDTITLAANTTTVVALTPPVPTARPSVHQAWVAQVMTASPGWLGTTTPHYGLSL